LLDEPLFVLGDLDVALGDQHLAVTWLHPQEAHARIMSKRGRAPAGLGRLGEASKAQDIHRTGAGPEPGQAVLDRLRRELLSRAGCLERVVPPCQPGRQHRGVRASRPMRGAARVALAGDLYELIAVEEQVDRAL